MLEGQRLTCAFCNREFITENSVISVQSKPCCRECFKFGPPKPIEQPNPTGRPEKYTFEYAEILAVGLRAYTAKSQLPLWCEFAYENKCNFRKAQDLCKLSEAFREAYEEMHAKEEVQLLKGGISGKFNSPMTQLVLKNHRMSVDYREKAQVDDGEGFDNYFQGIKTRAANRKKKREDKA